MKAKQFAALPFRMKHAKLLILLITTRRKGRWSVPKGHPIRRKQPHRTAAVEAYEEAGLLGHVSPGAIGSFRHHKRKGKRKVLYEVKLFAFKVKKQSKRWPERGQRRTIWLPASAAARRVHRPELRQLIKHFAREHDMRD